MPRTTVPAASPLGPLIPISPTWRPREGELCPGGTGGNNDLVGQIALRERMMGEPVNRVREILRTSGQTPPEAGPDGEGTYALSRTLRAFVSAARPNTS